MVKPKEINGGYYSGVITDVDNHPMNSDNNRTKIDRIVIHHNAGTSDEGARRTWYVSTGVGTSAHYQVTPKKVWGCVSEKSVAYHAGDYPMNQRSIGIEHLNNAGAPSWTIAEETYKNSARLIKDICDRYKIPLDRSHILGHREISSTQCPGGIDIDKLIRLAKDSKDDPSKPSDNDDNTGKKDSNSSSGGGTVSTTTSVVGTHMWRYNDFAWGGGGTKQGATNSAVSNDVSTSGNSSTPGKYSKNVGQLGGKAKIAAQTALDPKNWNAVTDSGNPGIDLDNFPAGHAAQCFDLANWYMKKIYPSWDINKVNERSNNFPHQYRSQFESFGWKIIENPSFKGLTIGAITYEQTAAGGPHTEMITAIEGNNISFLTQNYPSPSIITIDTKGQPVGTSTGRIYSLAIPPDNIVK